MAGFTLESTSCFMPGDKKHIVQIIHGFKEGEPAFAKAIKSMQKKLMMGDNGSEGKKADVDNPLVAPKAE
eukprot:COSAG06_NODE_1411_length_9546_cov_8.730602_6_plen_70_part_00